MIEVEITERLRDQCGSLFTLIEDALSLSSVVGGRPPATPALYVVPLAEESDANQWIGRILQRTEVDVGIVIILENVSDTLGQAAKADLALLKKAVRDALLGWEAPSSIEPLTHVSGQLTASNGGFVWWEEIFATSYHQSTDL